MESYDGLMACDGTVTYCYEVFTTVFKYFQIVSPGWTEDTLSMRRSVGTPSHEQPHLPVECTGPSSNVQCAPATPRCEHPPRCEHVMSSAGASSRNHNGSNTI